jgi:hypothetical protein
MVLSTHEKQEGQLIDYYIVFKKCVYEILLKFQILSSLLKLV